MNDFGFLRLMRLLFAARVFPFAFPCFVRALLGPQLPHGLWTPNGVWDSRSDDKWTSLCWCWITVTHGWRGSPPPCPACHPYYTYCRPNPPATPESYAVRLGAADRWHLHAAMGDEGVRLKGFKAVRMVNSADPEDFSAINWPRIKCCRANTAMKPAINYQRLSVEFWGIELHQIGIFRRTWWCA